MCFFFKSLHGLASAYISDVLSSYSPSGPLRSSDQLLLSLLLLSQSKTRGDRAFSIFTSRWWSSLLLRVRPSPSVAAFKSRLKTHPYTAAFESP